jgi:hypothetical protein
VRYYLKCLNVQAMKGSDLLEITAGPTTKMDRKLLIKERDI